MAEIVINTEEPDQPEADIETVETTEEVEVEEWQSAITEMAQVMQAQVAEIREASRLQNEAFSTLVSGQQEMITRLTDQIASQGLQTQSLIQSLLAPAQPAVIVEEPASDVEDLQEVVTEPEAVQETQAPAVPRRRVRTL